MKFKSEKKQEVYDKIMNNLYHLEDLCNYRNKKVSDAIKVLQ